MTLRSLPETLQTTALPSSLLYLVLSTSTYIAPIHAYTWLQRLSTCIFPDILLHGHTLRMRNPSYCILYRNVEHCGGKPEQAATMATCT